MRRHTSIAALLVSLGTLCGTLQGAQTAQTSTEAGGHLAEIITTLQTRWLHRDKFDWDSFRQRVFQKAGAAQTIPETYDAIRLALTLLGDKHNYYVTAAGEPIFNPRSPSQSTGECTPAASVTPQIPEDIGYVKIRISQPNASAEEIRDSIRRSDRPGLVGWIVDVRDSRGGNMWPSLAGIGPVLGDGTAGFFVDAANDATPWGYTNGRAWLGDQAISEAAAPHQLRKPNPRVALLTDVGVASSGETIAIAFRARPNTRSFGTPTCGLSTAVKQFPLSRGGRIAVVISAMADRTKKQYGGAVVPDELITEPAEVVPRALLWLRGP